MKDKLKPCPLCDGEASTSIGANIIDGITKEVFDVICDVCEIETPKFETEEEAINFWNTRPSLLPWRSPEDELPGEGNIILFHTEGMLLVGMLRGNRVMTSAGGYSPEHITAWLYESELLEGIDL